MRCEVSTTAKIWILVFWVKTRWPQTFQRSMLPPSAIVLELFNNKVDKNQRPQEWETGMVINIHKKGTKSKCGN